MAPTPIPPPWVEKTVDVDVEWRWWSLPEVMEAMGMRLAVASAGSSVTWGRVGEEVEDNGIAMGAAGFVVGVDGFHRGGSFAALVRPVRSAVRCVQNADGRRKDRVVLIPALGSTKRGAQRVLDSVREVASALVVVSDQDVGRGSWRDVADRVFAQITGEGAAEGEGGDGAEGVVLCGESTGGTLVLQMLCSPRRIGTDIGRAIDHVILVNPVTAPRNSLTAIARTIPGPLRDVLPADGLVFVGRRSDLIDRIFFPDAYLRRINVPVTIVVTEDDPLHPSFEESERLLRCIPNATRYLMRKGGHYPLRNGKLDTETVFKSAQVLADKFFRPHRYTDDVTMGKKELQQARADIRFLRQTVSPVIIGSNRVPDVFPGDRPVLFVGNHTLFGFLDLPFLIDHFLAERGVLVRGLAHELVLRSSQSQPEGRDEAQRMRMRRGETFGALPVSPRNLHKLMREKKWALLFPGGIREAHKGKNENYELMWPEEQEFIRTAAKFGAYVVPFATVGAEENFEILMDSKDIFEFPVVGGFLSQRLANVRSEPRRWKSDTEKYRLVPPLARPRLPSRLYIQFGRPIDTKLLDHKNRDACQTCYDEVKQSVRDLMADSLRRREEDPYADLTRRLTFETTRGVQAPTTWRWSTSAAYIPDEDILPKPPANSLLNNRNLHNLEQH